MVSRYCSAFVEEGVVSHDVTLRYNVGHKASVSNHWAVAHSSLSFGSTSGVMAQSQAHASKPSEKVESVCH
jgi:hypothetical protein